MAYYQHVWILAPNGANGLAGQPTGVGYFSPTTVDQAWPSHGDTTDASILTDGSDGTRAEFWSEINASNPDFFGNMWLDVPSLPQGTLNPPSSAELVVYYKADRDHRISLQEDASAGGVVVEATAVVDTTTSSASPLGTGWRKAPLVFPSGWSQTDAIQLLESADLAPWRLEITPPSSPSSTYHSHFSSWVAEVAVAFATEILVPPSCRKFPREDGLGVGGGRHFPPPKSRQRSGRRFGYY